MKFKRTAACRNEKGERVIVRRAGLDTSVGKPWTIESRVYNAITRRANEISRNAPAGNPRWENE